MSVIRAVPGLFYIIIAVATIIIFMMLMWQHVPQKCYEELNGTSVRVIDNLEKCADMCWRKHDFGSDLENDDCYIINVFVQDDNISKQDFENDDLHVYFDQIESGKQYKIKIRYNATGPEISLILLGVRSFVKRENNIENMNTTIRDKTAAENTPSGVTFKHPNTISSCNFGFILLGQGNLNVSAYLHSFSNLFLGSFVRCSSAKNSRYSFDIKGFFSSFLTFFLNTLNIENYFIL